MNNDFYLAHHGVKGMKWGVRKKEAKNARKARDNKAFEKYDKTIADIEKPYKRGQKLSDKDYAREGAADKKYRAELAKSKSKYNSDIQSIKNDKKEFRQDVKALKKAVKIGTVEAYDTTGKFIGKYDTAAVLKDDLRTKKGEEYVNAVRRTVNRENALFNLGMYSLAALPVVAYGAARVAAELYD